MLKLFIDPNVLHVKTVCYLQVWQNNHKALFLTTKLNKKKNSGEQKTKGGDGSVGHIEMLFSWPHKSQVDMINFRVHLFYVVLI